MGVYIEGLDMPKEHSLWMVIHPNGQVWMRKRHYCRNLEGVEATELDLVRCRECKYYNGHEEYCDIDHFARENGFCSSGKRRE